MKIIPLMKMFQLIKIIVNQINIIKKIKIKWKKKKKMMQRNIIKKR